MPISPLHVLLYQTFFFSKNVQIRFFSKFVDFCRCTSFRSGFFMLQRSYTFLFLSPGDWGTPQQAGLGTLYSYNVHQSPACSMWECKTGQIHFSRTWTKIKGFKIENIFLYKIQAQKNSLSMYMIWIGCIII